MSQHLAFIIQSEEKQNNLSGYIFDNIPTAVFTCDNLGYITSYNKAAVELWGREPVLGEDLWCGSWQIYLPNGEPLSLDKCPMARAMKVGVPILGEEILLERPNRERRNVLTYPSPLFDDSGTLVGAINTLVDITEQRLSETRQSVLAAIIESSQDAIISKTLDGVIISWNRAAEVMYGYTEEEALGEQITMLIPENLLAEEEFILGKVRKGEKVDHYETVRRAKNGRLVSVSLSVSPIKDGRGQIIGASKIARDITVQKENEAALRRNAENMETLNAIGKAISEDLDVQAILEKVTDATTQLTGADFGAFFYNKINEAGEPFTLYSLSGSGGRFDTLAKSHITEVFIRNFSGKGILRIDDIREYQNSDIRPVNLHAEAGDLTIVNYLTVPVISKSGSLIGGLLFGHSKPGVFTSEHEKLISGVAYQAALALDNARLYEEVRSLNAKKDEFIGLASHELKTPVTTINGYVQILAKSQTDPTARHFAEKALQQINKLSSLVSDLLDVSKIQTGNLPLAFVSFDLLQLVQEVIEMEKYSVSSHRITVDSSIPELPVVADKQRIEQVLINLISNAVKYSPQADRVEISVAEQDGKVKVGVRDFGIGIPKDQQERIFNRFYRVETNAQHFSGLGIGLYISFEIIRRHQGRLWVESTPGEGCEFFFEIPLTQEHLK
ncbi:MAG TPA: PAS domain S-box protein [Sphingobacteriaceae bacterium]